MTTALVSHGGNVHQLAELAKRAPEDILDFSASINPLGPPEWLRGLIHSRISAIAHYPDPDCTDLRAAAARRFGVDLAEVIAGNGSAELLHILPRALGARRAVIPVPSYCDYLVAAESAGLAVHTVPLRAQDNFSLDLGSLELALHGEEIVMLGQPNNPTGQNTNADDLRGVFSRWPRTTFIVDEAFADFLSDCDSLTLQRPANAVVLRSLTKFYGIPGLRLGLAIASREVITAMRRLLQPWSVNVLAQAVGEGALNDESDYASRTRELVAEERQKLIRNLRAIGGLCVFPGRANFLLVRVDQRGLDATEIARRMLRDGIAIRVCDGFDGLDARYFRVAVRTAEENACLCRALRRSCGLSVPAPARKTPAIMFQGTSSGAGKSLMTAAMCRILLEDGYRVAPFKSQNMSLNSFVTREGGEIGRAQVVQSRACRLEPDVRMNPILLKPCGDTGAQVIVWGQPVGNMSVEDYIRYKPTAFGRALEAYEALASQHDVMVLEGAGSPAEVNLKHLDIVNMRMARSAGARVLIVGDIDRGGVFASFAGTLDALAEWERRLVAGFVVNRFRGREALLAEALEWTHKTTGRPVLGVVPFLGGLGLPEEDSVGLQRESAQDGHRRHETVECAVIELPHLSNFTDFDALRIEPDVRLRFVRLPTEIEHPDALILPGSKNVFSDLAFLRDNGWDRAIARLAAEGRTEIVGICGGLQMLGRQIADPHALESAGQVTAGLGLLPATTTLEARKTLTRAQAKHVSSGLPVQGYEIHHGRTDVGMSAPCVCREDGEVIGVGLGDRPIWGTYLHGIFDADEFRRWFVNGMRRRRGLVPLAEIQAHYDIETAIQRLADEVRNHLDIERIYREVGLR